MATGLVIFGPDNEPGRRATPAEQARFDADQKVMDSDTLLRICLRLHSARGDKQLHQALKAKGLQQSKTRSTLAWKMRNRRESAEKFESFSERTAKDGSVIPPSADFKDWDYAPVGEGTLWRTVPRLTYKDLELFDVWIVRVAANGRKRRRCVEKGFKRSCGEGTCERVSCAMCWAIESLDVKNNETIVVKRREGNNPKVIDPSGVHPKGARNASAQDMGEDQRAPFGLTSTQQDHKQGASSQGAGTQLPRDPADAKRFHR